jgi:hypothetical protein
MLFPAKLQAWGFFAHKRINRLAVFCLPPEMLVFYKANLEYITTHAVDPDKRRYAVVAEGARHFIDLDYYGVPPFEQLPRSWYQAIEKYTADTLQRYGVLPWHLETMLTRLTRAFEAQDPSKILKLSADLGHYMADAHVPLHACSNHNGQHTNQHGIHALWETRIPELLADQTFNYWGGKAAYISQPRQYIWDIVTASAQAADTVLTYEKKLSQTFPSGQRYAFENRNGQLIKNYATAYTKAYHQSMGNMVERRMQESISAVAACWYTAWVNAGQPSLKTFARIPPSPQEEAAFKLLNQQWQSGKIFGREHE